MTQQRSIRREMEQEDEMEAAEEAAGFTNAIVLAPTPVISSTPDEEVTDDKQFQDLVWLSETEMDSPFLFSTLGPHYGSHSTCIHDRMEFLVFYRIMV